MATLNEISKAINIIKKYHSNIIILHCVSSYPTNLKNINLKRINILKKKFPNTLIGISDHTDNIYSSIAASEHGIVAIEKHFKLDSKDKSTDSTFSITPLQLRDLKQSTKSIFLSKKKSNILKEKVSKRLRRSIFAKTKIKKNEKITKNNIDTLRPKIGICASKYFDIIGKKLINEKKQGDPIFDSDVI